jgi:hypothetical protein
LEAGTWWSTKHARKPSAPVAAEGAVDTAAVVVAEAGVAIAEDVAVVVDAAAEAVIVVVAAIAGIAGNVFCCFSSSVQ